MITLTLTETDFDAIFEVMEKTVGSLRRVTGTQTKGKPYLKGMAADFEISDSQVVYERALRSLKEAKSR